MNYKVRIGNRSYIVELTDLNSRPIIAIVDGEEVEVWPQNEPSTKRVTKPAQVETMQIPQPTPMEVSAGSSKGDTNLIRAPIPGTIVSMSVEVGDHLEPGQELCLLEAMKMKNIIRANRRAEVAAIKVVAGQTVKHNDVLIEFCG